MIGYVRAICGLMFYIPNLLELDGQIRVVNQSIGDV